MDATFNYYSGGSSSNLSSPTSPRATHSTRRRLRSHQHRRRDYFLNRKFFRRKYFRYLLLLPLLYFSGVLSCLGSLSAMLYPSPLPGSVYRSHEIFQSLLTDIQSDTSLGIQFGGTPGNEFGDIYDEEHFIATLKRYVDVVREIPKELMEEYDFNISNIPSFRVPAWASAGYYLKEVYPVLKEQRIVRVAPFANRLASSLPPHIQYLRCLANYEALRFSISITTLANTLVKRMTADSSGSGGKYVSVHLRFEEDMVAFSCCVYDGGKSEQLEMDSIRQKGWGEKFKRKDYVIAPGRNRMNGRCPMTPLEVGMMLRGMGFANTTPIYLASGKIYQAGKNLAPLRKLFPLLHTKELLATPNELASLKGYSSRLAALDYIVCFFSEVFVTTQGGNFPQFLMGHRKFHYGHAKTIIPDKRKLAVLLHNTSISWHALKNEMQVMLDESDHKGVAIPTIKKTKRKNSIFANPLPQCQCLQESKFS
ncbi:GDP-fucose protein O-fucosyltransferase [Cynara cardunculus var. scolymus]|uniref:O-fucosyltransferase family protein n=1 Tax=Cynara cardunculus var. scolymus TaxID=59895 RepID=A0A103XMM4_CYNCS|nr:GDP-fucose protein O-fucosyltransferase [Cynara cardunculus var. scolymus]